MAKMKKTIEGAEKLSLGISIVVAILMGIGIGIWLKNTFNQVWLLWLGVFWGVAAAILNIKKEYNKLKKDLEELKEEYKNYEINKKN
jgi:ATP synthase protein I